MLPLPRCFFVTHRLLARVTVDSEFTGRRETIGVPSALKEDEKKRGSGLNCARHRKTAKPAVESGGGVKPSRKVPALFEEKGWHRGGQIWPERGGRVRCGDRRNSGEAMKKAQIDNDQ